MVEEIHFTDMEITEEEVSSTAPDAIEKEEEGTEKEEGQGRQEGRGRR